MFSNQMLNVMNCSKEDRENLMKLDKGLAQIVIKAFPDRCVAACDT